MFFISNKKLILILGILFNVVILVYFKYTNFLIENVNFFLSNKLPFVDIVFPLAISFITFQQIAFLVDSYYLNIKELTFIDYCLFMTFFPQLIAGPIVRYNDIIPQLYDIKYKYIDSDNISIAVFILFTGLFKKVIIADSFSKWANAGFEASKALSFFEAWATSLCYTIEIYFDFSSYTDMAIASALLFNIILPINFNSPYRALNIQEFWRRWHVSLSNWLKYFLYIPLGGNKKGYLRTCLNLFITFLIAGFWHGASWTFIIWGSMHGIALVVHRFWKTIGIKIPISIAWIITFMFVNISWVFFRSPSFRIALDIIKGMLGFNGIEVSASFASVFNYFSPWDFLNISGTKNVFIIPFTSVLYITAFAMWGLFRMPNILQMTNIIDWNREPLFKRNIRYALITALAAFISFLTFFGHTTPTDFIYTNF